MIIPMFLACVKAEFAKYMQAQTKQAPIDEVIRQVKGVIAMMEGQKVASAAAAAAAAAAANKK
jgi:hypothetical protein